MELTLDTVHQDIRTRLSAAACDRHSPMHTPVVATSDADVRIMVLREFDAENWVLRFHTDSRAPKARVIKNNPAVGVLFYDPEGRTQIRCRGEARLEIETQTAQNAWTKADTYARRCYLGAPPGHRRNAPTSGLPNWVEGERPTEMELVPARANFAVLSVEIETADWYHLSHEGHRRAIFERGEGQWLTP